MYKSVLVLMCLFFMGTVCNMKPTIDIEMYKDIDTLISRHIDNSADRCFEIVDAKNITGRDAYEEWGQCMEDFFRIGSIIQEIRDDVYNKDIESLRENSILLFDYMILLGLDTPEDFLKYIEGMGE